MKLLKKELKYNIWYDVRDKVNEHAPYGWLVREQIKKNLGWWVEDDLIRLKVHNVKMYIRNDLDETN